MDLSTLNLDKNHNNDFKIKLAQKGYIVAATKISKYFRFCFAHIYLANIGTGTKTLFLNLAHHDFKIIRHSF